MAHPTIWPQHTFFYPIGNTPPILLTQFLAPKEDANILLIGCGDPRNILYTLYACEADTGKETRCYDITCVDIEGAILARNVILFTLVVDNHFPENVSQVWNIFYHFFLDKASLELLTSQCRKLLELSQDMEAWYSGPYSRFLRISSSFTLSEMRKYWTAYVETNTVGSFKNRFVSGMKDAAVKGGDGPMLRSAGPLLTESLEPLRAAYKQFWKTGLSSLDQNVIKSAAHVNPTFAHSIQGSGFMAHYTTMPVSAFHLAPAFTSVQLSPSAKPVGERIFSTMSDQFLKWCMVFRGAILRQPTERCSVIIRLLVGDAFSACYTLQSYSRDGLRTANHRVSQWRAESLILNAVDYDSEGQNISPRTFNVIDTSNLSDHLGLVNIIVAASPLLTRSSTSSLNTETLLAIGENATTAFSQNMFGDVVTLSLLLDITPCSFVSAVTSYSNTHDILLHFAMGGESQFHERLFWKLPSLIEQAVAIPDIVPLSFEAPTMARLLFSIYLKMFHFENITTQFRRLSLGDPQEPDFVHYDRLSFALLLQAVMRRTCVDWQDVFRILLDFIRNDRTLPVGSNQYHDLIAQLDALGMYSATHFYPYGGLTDDSKTAHRTIPCLKDWDNVPPLLYITLAVPRERMRVLGEVNVGNPNLLVTICSHNYLNSFVIIQATFGAVVKGDRPDAAVIKADPEGGKGSGSVLVSFRVPVSTLVLSVDARITLNVQSTVASSRLIPRLGMYLELYETPFEDKDRVWVTRHPPQCIPQTPGALRYGAGRKAEEGIADSIISASVSPDAERLTHLTFRRDFTEPGAKEKLMDRSLEIKATQISPCGLVLSIGTALHIPITYPWPIEGSRTKLRVARQSGYIETVVPLAGPYSTEGMSFSRLPLCHYDGHCVPWNMHRVNLERLPLLDLNQRETPSWVKIHLNLSLSEKERAAQKESSPPDPSLDMLELKDPLQSVLLVPYRDDTGPLPVIALRRVTGGDPDTIFFVTGVRLDLPAHTTVVDAYVLPLNVPMMRELNDALESLMVSQIPITSQGVVAWKKAIPTMVERCRNWDHKPSCAYIKKGNIPLATEHSQIPICDCGRGKDNKAFLKKPEWRVFAPYVTRIALSPLFAVSYLVPIARATGPENTGSTPVVSSRCAKCGKSSENQAIKLLSCSRCKSVSYCSKECQKADWKRHKPACAV